MARWKTGMIAGGGIAGLIIAACLVAFRSTGAPLPIRLPKHRLGCRLDVGEELGFRLTSKHDSAASNGASGQYLHLNASMRWRVLSAADGGWVVAASLADVVLEETGAKSEGIDSPFLFRIGSDCRFRGFAFSAETSAPVRLKLESLLRSMEVSLPSLPTPSWTARHQDAIGSYEARYAFEAPLKEGDAAIVRERRRYATTSLPSPGRELGDPRVEILGSTAHLVLDPKGRWLDSFHGSEHLEIWMGSRLVGDVSGVIGLEREAVPGPSGLGDLRLDRFAWTTGGVQVRDSVSVPKPADPAALALDLDATLADFAKRIAAGRGGLHDGVMRLAAYLAEKPGAIDALMASLRGTTLDERLHGPLFLALEKTGTPAAERALAGALKDQALSAMDRMRAVAALPDVARPSEAGIQALIEQSRAPVNGASADDRDLAGTAVLALGTTAHNAAATSPPVAEMARAELRRRLEAGDGLGQTLDAIGNSGDAGLAEGVARYADDGSPEVRAHAAQAYRRMPAETAEPVLTGWLGRESSADVRRSIAASLLENTRNSERPASAQAIAAAAARLAIEPDPQVRGALISLLGTAAASAPEARQALIAQFHREEVVELKVLIGQFVSAPELR